MAAITKSGTPSLSSLLTPQGDILNCVAAEDIAAGDPCYISGATTDGQTSVTRANGAAANAAAKVRGIALEAAKSGEAVTLLRAGRMRWGAGMTPGADVYLGGSVAALADAASTGGTTPIGFVVNATVIQFDIKP